MKKNPCATSFALEKMAASPSQDIFLKKVTFFFPNLPSNLCESRLFFHPLLNKIILNWHLGARGARIVLVLQQGRKRIEQSQYKRKSDNLKTHAHLKENAWDYVFFKGEARTGLARQGYFLVEGRERRGGLQRPWDWVIYLLFTYRPHIYKRWARVFNA